MALVLDHLVFELGLDPKAFNRGSREATQAVKKTREGIEKEAQGIERAVQQAADRIDLLARNALRLFAIFTAGKSLGQFAADISRADAAMGRLATSIGQAPAEISAVAKAVERAGGSADGAAASFERWSDHVEQLRINGTSPLLETLNKLQAAGGRQIDYTRSQNEQFEALADNLDAVRRKMGIATATKMGKDLGFDPGLVALLVRGSAAYREAIAQSQKFGVATKEDTEAAQKLQTAIAEVRQTLEGLGRTIMTAVSPFLVQLLKDIQWLIGAFKDFIAVNIAPHLKEFADAMGVSGSSTKAFVVACEALFALWLGSKALAFLRMLGAVRALLMGGRVVAGGAAAGGGGLLGGIIGGLTVAGTIGADRSVPNANKPDLQRHWDDEASGAASGGGSAIARAWRWARRRMGFGGGAAAAGGGGGTQGAGTPSGSSAGNLTSLIEDEARKAGIDPRIMHGIRAGESLHQDKYDVKDDPIESSWGPFQLNRRRGLGVQFEKETGLDVRDPKTIPDQVRWVANFIGKGGSLRHWAGYHGPRDADPKWKDSGYVPSGAGIQATGSKEVAGGVHPLGGGGRLSSDYGWRTHPIHGDLRLHKGIDLAAPAGTSVQAMAAGAISLDRSGDVTVRHADGSSTTYRHVVPSVKEGDQVAAGQVIAQLRAHDPRSTGPHLHFEARNAKGGLIDPKTLLGPKAAAPKAIPEAGAIPGRSAWWRGSPTVGAYASQVARAQHSIMTSMADNRQTNTSTTSNSTTINGGIQVQTSATDASGIARDMEQALNRRSFAYRNQSGMA